MSSSTHSKLTAHMDLFLLHLNRTMEMFCQWFFSLRVLSLARPESWSFNRLQTLQLNCTNVKTERGNAGTVSMAPGRNRWMANAVFLIGVKRKVNKWCEQDLCHA